MTGRASSHKTFGARHGNGVCQRTQHTVAHTFQVARSCGSATAAAPETARMGRGRYLSDPFAMATPASARYAHQSIRLRFLPHSSCQPKRGSDGEATGRGRSAKYLRLVRVRTFLTENFGILHFVELKMDILHMMK